MIIRGCDVTSYNEDNGTVRTYHFGFVMNVVQNFAHHLSCVVNGAAPVVDVDGLKFLHGFVL